ncbi:glycosyltransferase family 2 protein [Megamonas funiformis]|uniref:glycosyltransferase family 2 protein n=1 Tax=Megamonas funiformis TaxID=437897 RepID=UPI0024317F93|nr:glycosyltransferase family A protein [Megamonas funiformis]
MINEIYKVSIVIPVYNTEKYLVRCLESIINQTYKNLEIILVDDGSKDNSREICIEYANKDKRIVLIQKDNEGQAVARNVGINKSNGLLIMFVDSDDWLDLNCIEICVSRIINNKNIDGVIFPYIREFENISKKNNFLGRKEFIISGKEMKEKIYRKLFGPIKKEKAHPDAMNDLNPPWGKLYWKRLLNDIRFTNTNIIGTAEDCFFNIEVFYNMNSIIYVPNVYYHYNKINQSSVVHLYNKNLIITRKNFHKYVKKFILDKKLDKEYINALNNRIIFNILDLSRNVMNSNESLWKKYFLLRDILKDKEYKVIFKEFTFKHLDLKWKIYYFFCKKSFVLGVMTMTFLAEILKKYLR